MSDSLTTRLRTALEAAVRQCEEHNKDYHHHTPWSLIGDWQALLRETEASGEMGSAGERSLN